MMTISDINKALTQLAEQPSRENILNFSFVLLQWMGLEPNANKTPQLVAPKTQKLKDFLTPAPQTVQPQLYRLNAENQNIRIRFAVVKKLKKEYISQLVDNDPGSESFQNTPEALRAITKAPYFLHFVATPEYNRLVLIFNHAEQKRIVSFRNRLTNTQYNKIIQQWQGIAGKSKAEISDLFWKSLDIKEVNKEFYAKIKERFDALVGIVKSNYVDATDAQTKQFTVRLIGRYIFCWFLKEKDIIPLVLIGKETIAGTRNYYQNTLLKLFFETLNTKVQDRNPLIHEKFFEKIPYLNGGLFDENEEDRLFKKLDLDKWLLPFVEILESYDFTVDESSSQYQQVAVDPEMLGRIFENLLASQNEETEKLANQRKAFGAFYTPREIVDYMVNESIRAYLQTRWENHVQKTRTTNINNPEPVADIFGNKPAQQLKLETKKYELKPEEKQKIEKTLAPLFSPIPDAGALKKEEKQIIENFLRDIKILDPACGSGAFPMGILHKLVELHEVLGTVKTGYELKKDILSQNIYGVDIMPMAVEIARLRAWLSLVLEEDYKPNDPKHNFGVKPLPNLDFKFICANSLIDLGLDAFIQESRGTLHEGFTQKLVNQLKGLEELRIQFFQPDLASAEKDALRKKYIQQRDKVIANIEADSEPVLKQVAKKIKSWNPFDDSKSSPFFSPTWMFGVDTGFDVVIGNPPYVQLQNNAGRLAKLYNDENFETFARTGDIYSLFYEKAFKLLKDKGILSFITSNKWMRAAYGEALRKFFITRTNPLWLIDFGGYQVFEATVDTNILMAEKSTFQNKIKTCTLSKDFSLNNMSDYFKQNSSVTSFDAKKSWVILSSTAQRIKEKIENAGIPLRDWKINIYRGILTGYNDAFIIDQDTRDKLVADSPKNAEIIRPILRGRDIQKYRADWKGLYIIGTFPSLDLKIENYPAIKEYLLSFGKDRLKQTGEKGARKKTSNKWFETQDSISYWDDFFKHKIVYPNMTKFLPFFYDTDNFYTNQKCFIITGENIAFLTAFFNSSLFKFCFKENFPELQGGTRELSKVFFDKIPVIEIAQQQNKMFENKIMKIQELKKENQNTLHLEKEIDQLIFDLYGLSNEERTIIGFIEIT